MTDLIFDREVEHEDDLWTTGRLIDELFLNLASKKEIINSIDDEGRLVTVKVHKYYHQARKKMYRIPITRSNLSNMAFVIHLSDLTERVKTELDLYYDETGEKGLMQVLKLAVCLLFENLDFEYTHCSIMKRLKLRIVTN